MNQQIETGAEYSSAPYVLDAAAAQAYLRAVEAPRRRQRENIHNDLEAARRAGFAAPIAAGEHSLALLAQFLADRFGMNFLRGGRFEVAFIKPVHYGDRLTACVRVTGEREGAITLEVWVENGAGDRVLTGTATIAAGIR
jgi:acyl dehydratase